MKTKENITVYINGSFLPAEKATVSVFDRGLNYGDGLFETMRSYSGKIFLAREHIKRLKLGARTLGIPTGELVGLTAMSGVLQELLRRNSLVEDDAIIKIILTRGEAARGHGRVKSPSPTLIASASKLDKEKIEKDQKKGVHAIFSSVSRGTLGAVKSLNYLPCVLAKAEAEKKNSYEALFITDNGTLLEGTATNLFIVKKGRLVTPPANGLILPGITREKVLELAKKNGIQTYEKSLNKKTLLEADEAFLTNSIIGLAPLVKAEGKPVGAGLPGEVTFKLLALYQEAAKPR